jgi:hypothetical protein
MGPEAVREFVSRWWSAALALVLMSALVVGAARSQEAEDQKPLADRPEATEPTDICPCFDPAELAEMPGNEWDLCVHSDATVQVARWFGKRTPEGKEGFNLIATRPTARTMGGSCLQLRRFRVEGVLEQAHSNLLDLPRDTATACHAMLEAWLESRGGCQTEVARTDG